MRRTQTPLKAIRQRCLDCSGGSAKYATWCPCDGLHSTRCELWLFRFGIQPATVRPRYGDRLLTPEKMPPANISLEALPDTIQKAATEAISVDDYSQPPVKVVRKYRQSPEQRKASRERIRRLQNRAAGAPEPSPAVGAR
jgi:hypothetical protein